MCEARVKQLEVTLHFQQGAGNEATDRATTNQVNTSHPLRTEGNNVEAINKNIHNLTYFLEGFFVKI